MSRDPQKHIVNGHEWEIYPWDAMHGLRMQARLAKLIGPAIGQAGGADKQSLMEMDVGAVIGALVERVNDQETPQLIRDMLHGTFVDGQDISMDKVFNEHFSGNYAELYEGLAHIVRVNFGDLFTMAASIGNSMGAADSSQTSPES